MRGYKVLTAEDNAEAWLDYYCRWKVSDKPEVLEEDICDVDEEIVWHD